MIGQHPVVRAAVGPPLVSPTRRRPVGRIGGLAAASPVPPTTIAALYQALGSGAAILGVDQPLVADWDCCTLDDQPIGSMADWRRVVDRPGDLGRVRGAFAVAWLDADGGLHLARDGVGERTLYYAPLAGGGVGFASSLHALLATGEVDATLDLAAVAAYLTCAYLPGEQTLVRAVREVLPGETLAFGAGGDPPARARSWSLPAEPAPDEAPAEDALRDRLRKLLEDAVARRLPSPGAPLGATLSGGIDSSLVVALARRLHDGPLHTYSVSFGPEYPNELAFSSLVADHCGTVHRIVEISPTATLRYLDESVALLSDPIGDPLTVPNALLFREAAETVGVVLNGEGGDPCFGGPKNQPMLLAEIFGDTSLRGGAGGLARERSYLRAHQKCYDDLPSLLGPDALAAIADDRLERPLTPWFADPRWSTFVNRLMAMNVAFKGGHHILPKVDAISFAFGVLPRSPLFDRAVVEIAFAISPQLKLRGTVEKYLLKQAVRDLLPAPILERPKSGMLVPVEGWFRGPLLPHARERLLDGLARQQPGLFRRDYLERLLAGRLGGLRPRHGAKIWLLLTLESWLRGTFRRS